MSRDYPHRHHHQFETVQNDTKTIKCASFFHCHCSVSRWPCLPLSVHVSFECVVLFRVPQPTIPILHWDRPKGSTRFRCACSNSRFRFSVVGILLTYEPTKACMTSEAASLFFFVPTFAANPESKTMFKKSSSQGTLISKPLSLDELIMLLDDLSLASFRPEPDPEPSNNSNELPVIWSGFHFNVVPVPVEEEEGGGHCRVKFPDI